MISASWRALSQRWSLWEAPCDFPGRIARCVPLECRSTSLLADTEPFRCHSSWFSISVWMLWIWVSSLRIRPWDMSLVDHQIDKFDKFVDVACTVWAKEPIMAKLQRHTRFCFESLRCVDYSIWLSKCSNVRLKEKSGSDWHDWMNTNEHLEEAWFNENAKGNKRDVLNLS